MSERNANQWKNSQGIEEVKSYAEKFSVEIAPSVWDDIYGWCKAAKSEVSGLGIVERDGGEFVVTDAFLLDQVCGSGSTEIDTDAIAKLQFDLHKKKIPQSALRFWWHTHYNFNVFWSGTDVATMKILAGSSADWMLSMVINQKDDYKCRLDMLKPFHHCIDEIMVILDKEEQKVPARYLNEVSKKVRTNTPIVRTIHSGGAGRHYRGNGNKLGFEKISGLMTGPGGLLSGKMEGDQRNLSEDFFVNGGESHGEGYPEDISNDPFVQEMIRSKETETKLDFDHYYWNNTTCFIWCPPLGCYVEWGSEDNEFFDWKGEKNVPRAVLIHENQGSGDLKPQVPAKEGA